MPPSRVRRSGGDPGGGKLAKRFAAMVGSWDRLRPHPRRTAGTTSLGGGETRRLGNIAYFCGGIA